MASERDPRPSLRRPLRRPPNKTNSFFMCFPFENTWSTNVYALYPVAMAGACVCGAHVRGKFERLPLDFKALQSIGANEVSLALDDVIGLIKFASRRCDRSDSPTAEGMNGRAEEELTLGDVQAAEERIRDIVPVTSLKVRRPRPPLCGRRTL